MKLSIQKFRNWAKLSNKQFLYLADICKSLSVTGFLLPFIASHILPQIHISWIQSVTMFVCGIVFLLCGVHLTKRGNL